MSVKLKLALGATVLWLPLAAQAVTIERWQQEDGAKVLFVAARGNPILDVRVDIDAGHRRDEAAKPGVAGLTLDLLAGGIRGQDEERISARWADLAADYSTSIDQDRAGLRLRTLSSRPEREAALAQLAGLMRAPTFPAAVLAREKARAIAGLKQEEADPQAVAQRRLMLAMYGDHPYALTAKVTPASLAAVRRADLVAYWQRYFHPQYMTISLVGDVSRDEAAAIARRLTTGLPRAGGALPEIPPVPAPKPSELHLPHRATQANVMLGEPMLTRDDPDYYPLVIGNYTLGGGGFDARLMKELRDKRGLTYGAYSYLAPYQRAGEFTVGVATRHEQADQALAVAREVVRDFAAQGPNETELAQAKANVIGGFPLRYDSNRKLLEYVAAIGFYNLPLSWLDDYPKAVEALDVATVRDAWRRRLDPAALAVVVVGGPADNDKAKTQTP